jgi:long-chain acyl-CoA synthetase
MDGCHLVVGPLYHAGPSAFSWGSLHVGHVQIVTERFDPEEILRLIETHHVTNTHLVATMFHRLLALPPEIRSRYDVSSLRVVVHSAAPTPVEVKKRMMEWWGPVIWETYGGTEGAATIAKPHHWAAKPGTVGRAVRGVELKILDEQGEPCPTGTPGAVYFEREGPRFEYWKDDAKTRSSYRGNAMTLGDLGYVDEDGFLYLTGRGSETIISGGVNIYPAEVENVLLTHPAVEDLAVIGVPDEEWGERVLAVVQPKAGIDLAGLEEDLIRFCQDHMARYKCPRQIVFRSELPREENGKLYRRRLRDEFWQESGRAI